jgi:glycosyltransferase involved in cell wall biosynthesis
MKDTNSVPTVSVCIPTYNRENYLKETLQSVFAQTYKDYEIVIVDDGSTDGTGEMIRRLGYNIRYHWQENVGDAAARNKLIELAVGKYITFLDSDDLLMPDAVERMVNVMEAENEEVIVYGSYVRIDENGNVCGSCKRKLYSGHITKYLFRSILVHSCGSMLPQKVLKAAGGFDETLPVCCDYDLWLRLSLSHRFIALPEPTFKRRRHKDNLSVYSKANRLTELKVLERFYYQGGGRCVIPEKLAMRRLSEETYRVGKCALKEGEHQEAKAYFHTSLSYRLNPKSLAMWILATIKAEHSFRI